jgi:hypothetical protein
LAVPEKLVSADLDDHGLFDFVDELPFGEPAPLDPAKQVTSFTKGDWSE